MIDRRQFLGLLAGSLVLQPAAVAAPTRATRLLSCRDDAAGGHYLSALDLDAGRLVDIRLPSRGHGLALHPAGRQAAVPARRPGDFLWIVDLDAMQITHRITAGEGRHYYGHAVYSRQGAYLYTSENHIDSGRGVIGVHDVAAGYRRVGEIDSHGIGPHELAVLADDKTLVVANGGIHTHPDTGRAKLNLPTMQPGLAYIDVAADRLLDSYRPPDKWHQLSIRHLDVDGSDGVSVAMQFQGSRTARPPLVALHRGEAQLRLLSAPDDITPVMKNYCGSVRFNRTGSHFAVSSPRGGIVTLWSAHGEYLDHVQVADGCGIAAAPGNGFFISSGNGSLCLYDPETRTSRQLAAQDDQRRWDNHLDLA